jgi:hypothetical protein
MTLRTASRRTTANRRVACRRRLTLAEAWRTLVKDLFDPYRPELHYMRGPGPKWHAKHDPATSDLVPIPVLVRVRVKR